METMPRIIDKDNPYLHVHYRAIHLKLDATQKAAVERFFGIVRVITNYLLLKTKNYSDEQARSKSFTVRDLMPDVEAYVASSNLPLFKEGQLTPELLKGILVSWVSEWEDFRNHRIHRPVFRRHQDPQKFYIIDTAVEYTENNIKLRHCPEFDFYLRSSRFPLSHKAPLHLVKRNESGEYWLFTLHESVKYTPDPSHDDVLAGWCSKILELEREMKTGRRRYLSTAGSRKAEGSQYAEIQLLTMRKITLDRLLRARDVRVVNHLTQQQLHQDAA